MRRSVSTGSSMPRPQSITEWSWTPSRSVLASMRIDMSILPACPLGLPAVMDTRARARRWCCLSIRSLGQVSGVVSWNSASRAVLIRVSKMAPVSGSSSPRRHHIPVSRSTQVRSRVLRRCRSRVAMPSSRCARRISLRRVRANSPDVVREAISVRNPSRVASRCLVSRSKLAMLRATTPT